MGAVENLAAIGREFGVFFGEIGFGELLVGTVGVDEEEVAFGFGEDVFVIGEPLEGAGGDAAILPAEGFGFADFDGGDFEFGEVEPLFRFLAEGVVEVDFLLLAVGEELAVGGPDGGD